MSLGRIACISPFAALGRTRLKLVRAPDGAIDWQPCVGNARPREIPERGAKRVCVCVCGRGTKSSEAMVRAWAAWASRVYP